MKKVLIVLIVLAIVAGAAYRVYQKSNMKQAETTRDIQLRDGLPVETAKVEIGEIESRLLIYGTLKGRNEIPIYPKVGGRILQVYVDNGDRVGAGRLLVQIETKEIQDQVDQARAGLSAAQQQYELVKEGARPQERTQAENQLENARQGLEVAKSNFERMQKLLDSGVITQQTYDSVKLQCDTAKTMYENAKQQMSIVNTGARDQEKKMAEQNVKQAAAAVAYAESQIKNASITSPVSGVIASRMFDPGTLVGPTSPYPLMYVVDDSSFSIKADISEIDLDKVKIGQPVEITIDAIPGVRSDGTITEINPSATMGTRTYTLKVEVKNRDGLMKSGMFARGSVRVAVNQNALKIPKDSIIKRNGKDGVFVVNANKVKFAEIETGIINTLHVEVTKGLTGSEEIVVVGASGLNDGDKVKVIGKTSK
jgi:HlyD family secretion protein